MGVPSTTVERHNRTILPNNCCNIAITLIDPTRPNCRPDGRPLQPINTAQNPLGRHLGKCLNLRARKVRNSAARKQVFLCKTH